MGLGELRAPHDESLGNDRLPKINVACYRVLRIDLWRYRPSETLVIHQGVEKNGYWDNALAGEWTANNRDIDDLGWYGETSGSGTELVPGTYLLGTVALYVANGTTLNDVATFSMAKS